MKKDDREYLVDIDRFYTEINKIASEANLLSIRARQEGNMQAWDVLNTLKEDMERACVGVEIECRDDFRHYDIW